MMQEFNSAHFVDSDLTPAGGAASAPGIQVRWQAGPLKTTQKNENTGLEVTKENEPNGAFVETLLAIGLDRLRFYQKTRFACDENEAAIANIVHALAHLDARTKRRIEAGTEGTHNGN